VTEGFLRLLVYINDNDARVDVCPPSHLKAIIETAQLQSIDGVEKRGRTLTQKRGRVDREGAKGNNQADGERTLVTPPLPHNLDESLADAVRHAYRKSTCDGLEGTDRRKASKRLCWIQDKNLNTVRQVRSRAPPLGFRYTVTRFRSNTEPIFKRMPTKKRLLRETGSKAEKLASQLRATRQLLKVAEREREQLNEIGVALSSQRNISVLLTLILKKAREITGADAGSLYLVEEDAHDGRHLRFKLTQNDSFEFPFQEFTLPLTEDSMAGYTALRGEVLNFADAYKIPSDLPFRFNDRYDRESGYHTRSLLSLPMKNAKGEVIGVLQLINSKRDPALRLKNADDVAKYVQLFRERSVGLALSLASQAAVAYENRKLYNDIETLFEGFVSAAVTAIEQRDPTTSGHSLRVATYTQALAEAVNAASNGPYAATHFDHEQMKEIRYAALLHDFGKVGVREEVLVKATKLYPLQMELVRQRFDYIRKELEASNVRRKLQVYLERDRGDALQEIARLSEDFEQRQKMIAEYVELIIEANEPTLLEHSRSRRLQEIAKHLFLDPQGMEEPYLKADEVGLLSIPKGSLNAAERLQIESHVVHTYNFLSRIPWTNELKKVPEIARAHHEKLNGSGYPYKLRGDQIPLPTKMMTICDIFDALTAADRPYKRAVATDRALGILDDCVRAKEIDSELFRLFREARVYERGAH
jgi:HD-GYP domain-containing protein (c-di-GMP phosphodiesterase class II)